MTTTKLTKAQKQMIADLAGYAEMHKRLDILCRVQYCMPSMGMSIKDPAYIAQQVMWRSLSELRDTALTAYNQKRAAFLAATKRDSTVIDSTIRLNASDAEVDYALTAAGLLTP